MLKERSKSYFSCLFLVFFCDPPK